MSLIKASVASVFVQVIDSSWPSGVKLTLPTESGHFKVYKTDI